MKVLTFSRHFPKGHPKAGQQTFFVEKVLNCFRREDFSLPTSFIPWTENYVALLKGDEYLKAMAVRDLKHHTIRAGSRFSPGEKASLRMWSDKPYRSKQIEFAQVEVKKVWSIEIVISHTWWSFRIDDKFFCGNVKVIANNDGLELQDFIDWFTIHPKSIDREFKGQVICWNDQIEY
jgi:hypothetical protein